MSIDKPDINRLLAAYAKKKHDRVPNLEISIDPGALQSIMGLDERPIGRSDNLDASFQMKLAQRTCQDAIICNLQYWMSPSGSLCSYNDLDKIGYYDPSFVQQKISSFSDAISGTDIGIGLMLAGPFFTTCYTMGPIPIQSFMLSIYDDINLVEKIMDIQVDGQIEVIKALEGAPIHFVEIADDLADNRGLMVNPSFYEEIWFHRIEKLVDAVKIYLKVPIQFHCCGKLTDVLPYLAKLNVDAIAPIQANCNDIYSLKKEYAEKFCFVGNMAIEGVLAFGTPDEVRQDTKKHIDELSYDGGYVVASSHSICDSIPAANYFAMIETAMNYGVYK